MIWPAHASDRTCFLAIGITTGLIGTLKQLTKVHCPWDLQDFGGDSLYVTLFGALLVGSSFAFAQEARGAHFLSHDVWSAAIAWCVCLALHRLLRESAARRAPPH